MKRPPAILIAAMLLAGCKSPTAAIDPFFGRQTVAPPNSVLSGAAPLANNYYQPPPTTVGANSPPPPATAANGPGSAFAPPGGNFGFSGAGSTSRSDPAASRLGSRPAANTVSSPQTGYGNGFAPSVTPNNPAMRSTNPGESLPSSGSGASSSNNNVPFQARITPPVQSGGFRAPTSVAARPNEPTTSNVGNTFNSRGATLGAGSSPSNSSATSNPNGFYTPPRLRTPGSTAPPADIMNLPDRNAPLRRPTGTGAGAFNAPGTSSGTNLNGAGASNYDAEGDESGGFRPIGNVRRASFTAPAEEGAAATKRSSRIGSLSGVGSRGDYGKDASYGWLRGKLEYSKTEDRWKLRYIPIDGETDDYGGSVTLLGSRELEGFEAGDFVTAYGTLGETSTGGRDFAAAYRLDRVVRQSE